MPGKRNDGNTTDEEILCAFAQSLTPQAIVYMPNGCYTLAVNERHWHTFGSQLPAPQPNAITQLLLQTREPVPGALWHCKQIRSIEALRRDHCSLEIAYDRLRPKQIAKSLEFVRVHTTDDARTYQVWIITASLVRPENEHLMLVRLTPVRDVAVHVLTIGTTKQERITKVNVQRAGKIWLPYRDVAITERGATEYFQMDRQLEYAENECRAGHIRRVLELLRDTASQYHAPEEYQQRLLLETLGQGLPSPTNLARKIHCLRARLYDAFPVMERVCADLFNHLMADKQLKDDDPPADAGSVDDMNEYWEFDEPQYEAALSERAAQEQKAVQYRLVFLERPTRALVTQLVTSGPQTHEQLAREAAELERPLDALINEHLVYKDKGRYHLATAAKTILNTAWGQTIREEMNRSPRS
jgi:hypothetical protein